MITRLDTTLDNRPHENVKTMDQIRFRFDETKQSISKSYAVIMNATTKGSDENQLKCIFKSINIAILSMLIYFQYNSL